MKLIFIFILCFNLNDDPTVEWAWELPATLFTTKAPPVLYWLSSFFVKRDEAINYHNHVYINFIIIVYQTVHINVHRKNKINANAQH
jgi:hypothetical protein